MKKNTKRKWWKKKKITIPLVLLLLFAGVYIVFEDVALRVANDKAKEVNPEFKGHIQDLDLNLLKGGVTLEQVTATLKKNDREFLNVKELAVDLDWSKVLTGQIVFEVNVDDFHLKYDKDIINAVKRLPKEEDKKKGALPFRISKVDIKDSEVSLLEYPGVNGQKHLTVNNIAGVIRNISGQEGSTLGVYDLNATFTGESKIKVDGHFDMAAEPLRWDSNFRLLGFNLSKMNDALRQQIPVNYKEGSLDVYAEAKSTGGKIYGYIKTFLNDVKYMGNNAEFKGAKHFLIEALGTFSNWSLENDKKDTVATRIPFIYENGAFSAATGKGLRNAIEHGLLESDEVNRGIENTYSLNKTNPAEVQAQEEDLDKAKEKKADKAEEKKEDIKEEKKKQKEEAQEEKEEKEEKKKD